MSLTRVLSIVAAPIFPLSICLALPLVLYPSVVQAQNPLPPPPIMKAKPVQQEIDPGEIIKVETTEILLPVTVRDRHGELVSGLTRRDFRVFEEGVEQPLSDLGLRQV